MKYPSLTDPLQESVFALDTDSNIFTIIAYNGGHLERRILLCDGRPLKDHNIYALSPIDWVFIIVAILGTGTDYKQLPHIPHHIPDIFDKNDHALYRIDLAKLLPYLDSKFSSIPLDDPALMNDQMFIHRWNLHGPIDEKWRVAFKCELVRDYVSEQILAHFIDYLKAPSPLTDVQIDQLMALDQKENKSAHLKKTKIASTSGMKPINSFFTPLDGEKKL